LGADGLGSAVSAGVLSDITLQYIDGHAGVGGYASGVIGSVTIAEINGSADAGGTGNASGELSDVAITSVLGTASATQQASGNIADVLVSYIKGSADATVTYQSGFEAQKRRMVDIAFRRFGVDGFYKSKITGATETVRVIVKHDLESNPDVLLSGISEKITALDFKYSEVPDPRGGDTVTINNEKFTVDEEIGNNRITTRVSVT